MRRFRIILQARTTSRRLPAKVLLPIGGFPLAILCAKRLQNTGREVVLATSQDETDDTLWRLAEHAGVRVCRGCLDDVLGRFLTCAQDLADDDVIIRATADNPLPDGGFVDLLVEKFLQQDLAYLGTNSPTDGLPYGLSGEVFTVGALREAADVAETRFDREHVTPVLRQRTGSAWLIGPGQIAEGDHSQLRCTVDTLEDFLSMAGIFASCADPIAAPWRSLLDRLPRVRPDRDRRAATGSRGHAAGAIMLGTAQLGMPYGIANRSGYPSDDEARSILDLALASGVTYFDTARSYGNSEARIGSALGRHSGGDVCVVTKLEPLSDLTDNATAPEIVRALEASVFRSCHALRRRQLDVLMFHRSADMVRWHGAAMEHLERLAEQGTIGEIGVSVYSPEEAIQCIADTRIKHLQMPFNLLDSRWTSEAFRNAVGRRPDLKVHARSVFLQGLLISGAAIWPEWATSSRSIIDRIARLCAALGRRDPSDLCMAYIRAFPWVTTLVLGVERRDQLIPLLENARERPLSASEVKEVQAAFLDVPKRLLNPAEW